MRSSRLVLVVGAGGAGSAAASARSQDGPGVQTVVVGDEPRLPYSRTTVLEQQAPTSELTPAPAAG